MGGCGVCWVVLVIIYVANHTGSLHNNWTTSFEGILGSQLNSTLMKICTVPGEERGGVGSSDQYILVLYIDVYSFSQVLIFLSFHS